MEYKFSTSNNENPDISLSDLSNAIRILSADAIEKANSGHPGMPLGMADIMTILVREFLNFVPFDPRWQARDRLVLSAGHGSMLLYSYLFLAGYDGLSIDEIKNFRQFNSITAGHPEYRNHPAIETTTGPLGQGLANAVGMAIAQKKNEIFHGKNSSYKIYTIVGDGCLMEGISYEAASLAGHLNLNNLIVIFDNNKITIDGKTSLSISENHLQKFEAMGFETIEIDGHNFEEIRKALNLAQTATRPFFISCKTKIGFAAGEKEGSEKSHGAPLGSEIIKELRKNLSWKYEAFYIPDKILNEWKNFWKKSEKKYNDSLEYFKLGGEIYEKKKFLENKNQILEKSYQICEILCKNFEDKAESTRVSFGEILKNVQKSSANFISGSADLSSSNCLIDKNTSIINQDDFSGNFIHFGVRENAMAAICNGLAIENYFVSCGTFLVFSDYMRPSIRLSAIMGLNNLYVMTHDSIGVGEDGPTHQPVEHLASFRSMPGIYCFRPCDKMESYASFIVAFDIDYAPKIIALSRQNLSQFCDNKIEFQLKVEMIKKGAYILSESKNLDDENSADKNFNNQNLSNDNSSSRNSENFGYKIPENIFISIFSSGSEISIAMELQKILHDKKIPSRVISVPCMELFIEQDDEYKNYILSSEFDEKQHLKIAIEAGVRNGWDAIIDRDGLFFGVEDFGKSSPASKLYDYFNLTAEKISKKIDESILKLI